MPSSDSNIAHKRAGGTATKGPVMKQPYAGHRREFLATVGTAGAAAMFGPSNRSAAGPPGRGTEKLAIAGGVPVRKTPLHFRSYGPQFYDDVEKRELIEVLESKAPFRWHGGESKVLQFEQAYAAHIGVKHTLAVTSGTTALLTAMAALEIGPGDEVILPAWTWYADYDAIVTLLEQASASNP